MDQDDVGPGEVLPVGFVLDHIAAVVTDELQADRDDAPMQQSPRPVLFGPQCGGRLDSCREAPG